MSKKVLIISASPRKMGNSDILCNEFARGSEGAGNSVEKIRLAEKKVGFCHGCGTCLRTDKCIINDDAPTIIEKMLDADVIVLATPVYFFCMDAQLKALIDRTAGKYINIKDKEFYIIATAAENDPMLMDRTFDSIKGFLDCLENPKEMGQIRAAGLWDEGEVLGTAFMRQAYEMGSKV